MKPIRVRSQEAFQRAWRGFAGFDRSASFKGWLYRIIVNQIIDRSRRRRQVSTCSLDTGPGALSVAGWAPALVVDPSEGPEELAMAATVKAEISSAIDGLPDRFANVLRLYAFGGNSYQDVADNVGISIGTVRSRLHRARHMLRDSLGRGWESPSGASPTDHSFARAV